MAYNAVLNFKGSEFDVVRCEFNILREVDSKGRPASNLYGGTVNVVIESTADNTVFIDLATQFGSNSGTITFKKDEVDVMKELSWENGYIIDYNEGASTTGGNPMAINFTVSAQKLVVEGVTLEQNWPEV
ncbi:MAG: type VI secretion system needle protein Hcp [Tannerella sp.]|jgi:hypothetical protein|nr:type VI secretion system needle protein Hcp [Tannerella sp.]